MAKMELESMQELVDKVNKLGSKGNMIKEKALNRAGDIVKKSMEQRAPRSKEDKKHMADYIGVSAIENVDGIDSVQVGPNKGDNSEFFYSKFTEWGTSKIPAQHWAENSLNENKRNINKIIEEELRKGIES